MSNNGKVEFDGDNWFFSYRDSGKVADIEADPTVELAYIATDQGTWVSLEGQAEIVEDDARKRELWDEDLEVWFKGGPDDERIVLLKVRAQRIHGWAHGEEVLVEPGAGVKRIASLTARRGALMPTISAPWRPAFKAPLPVNRDRQPRRSACQFVTSFRIE